jgi:ABC-type sugar transport system permease subunit
VSGGDQASRSVRWRLAASLIVLISLDESRMRPAAAFSLIYFLIILLFCFVLYNWMQRVGTQEVEVEK